MRPRLKKLTWVLLPGFLLLLPYPSFAEFYKYRDETGAIRFTDDLTQVPPDQRPKVQNYAEPKDFATPDEKPRQNRRRTEEPSEPATSVRENPEEWAARLKERKSALEQEYNEIIRVKQTLKARRATLGTPASYQEYNKEQARLRDRAEAYERERKRFEEEVEAYNQSLEFPQPVQ